ncbi:MAG: NAD-dependent DNA ligase LigA, partial [Lachnospiraceae bacterium]|nr:NAD-dependent DNA ligase LigA [Lachnospiraceae bacterium]
SKAVTRGNGEVGEVITDNAKTFINLPIKISFKEKLVLRGEAVISYPDFEKVNAEIENDEDKYKNPRNLCSGSVRQLNSEITAKRHVRLIAFSLISSEGTSFKTRKEEFDFLKGQGFEVVEHFSVTKDTIESEVKNFAKKIESYEIPSDGLVLTYDDIEYGKSLGMTAKSPRHSIAFKWQDETAETVLREIEWSPSRTGLINPVAIFDTVELEGTSVSRASVHNLSVMEELRLGIGDRILVYKANMIIPQIAKNITQSGNLEIPNTCPCCGGKTEVRTLKEAKSLYCCNPECPAKQIKKFSLFVSRDAFNVDGLSEATLEKFVDEGFIKEYSDIFELKAHKDSIVNMEGFGEKSFENLMDAIEKAKDITLPKFIYSLGILNVGLANAKLICKTFNYDVDKVLSLTKEDLLSVEGIGEVIADSYVMYFGNEKNKMQTEKLLKTIRMQKEDVASATDSLLNGKTVVVTGSLNRFGNRKDLQEEIEKRGGKVSSSVSKNTFVLVNNDLMSASSKNKTAKELGVPIISEDDFIEKYLG